MYADMGWLSLLDDKQSLIRLQPQGDQQRSEPAPTSALGDQALALINSALGLENDLAKENFNLSMQDLEMKQLKKALEQRRERKRKSDDGGVL